MARYQKDVWSQAIRPALTDKHGWAILISTPKSFNWFYDMFTREKTDERYKSFHYTSHDNPFLTEEELEDLAKDMSEDDFRQEIMAVFITTGGSVFKDFREVLKNVSPTPIPNRTYVIGVDIGQTQDFTVISVGDMTAGAQVYLERFNQTDWAYIKERIKVNHLKYNHGIVIFDSTGKGEPLYEDLLKMKVSSYPYRFTNPSKEITVNALRLAISNRTLTLLEDQAQIDELQAYEYRKTAAGATQYGAPSGKHDDIVTAVMLMAWGMEMSCSDTIGEISKEEGKPESPWLDEDDKKWAWDVEEDEPTFDDND